jgi:Raf kinase inhibitor-like YbhB/YbcL family protein
MQRTCTVPVWIGRVLALSGCTGGGQRTPKEGQQGGKPMSIVMTSTAFEEGQAIPKKHAYAGEGENVSPPLAWSGVPAGTKELALICDDPDAPVAEPWVHWVLYKIPASASGLAEGEAAGGLEGLNGWGKPGWGGPMPPKGHGTHRYFFKVYVLDAALSLAAGADKKALVTAMEGHVLAEGQLMGTYERT